MGEPEIKGDALVMKATGISTVLRVVLTSHYADAFVSLGAPTNLPPAPKCGGKLER